MQTKNLYIQYVSIHTNSSNFDLKEKNEVNGQTRSKWLPETRELALVTRALDKGKTISSKQLQSTTRMTDFFVVGNMSGILVRFVILVRAPIGKGLFSLVNKSILCKADSQRSSITEY